MIGASARLRRSLNSLAAVAETTARKMAPLPPGSSIGILGGGQLGRMIVLAAAGLGYRGHVFCQNCDEPAAQVCGQVTAAEFEDESALKLFAASVDVVTFEFENVPTPPLAIMAGLAPLRPKPRILEIAQDRLSEKGFLASIGVPTAPYASATDISSLAAALDRIGRPAFVKSARWGYDGKGQVKIDTVGDADSVWAKLSSWGGSSSLIVESAVDFDREISVIVARGLDGQTVAYDAVENLHHEGILLRTMAPALIPTALAAKAQALAARIAVELDLVGILAVEMFITRDGMLLVNELAPRPHNSGHWTIDACAVSQFEQLVRAVAGLALGSAERHSDAVMDNLIGADVARWKELAEDPAVRLHLYGKKDTRPGRKMGHVTRLNSH